MSAGSISLESALRTCKVQTSNANKIESDRFLNPQNMVCPIWSGVDTSGREVCPDSYYTKRAGCNSAEDRVVVENNQRPQYMEYINLSANGIDGSIYGDSMIYQNEGLRTKAVQNAHTLTGTFGEQLGGSVVGSCGYRPYAQAMSQMQNSARQTQSVNESFKSYNKRRSAGM